MARETGAWHAALNQRKPHFLFLEQQHPRQQQEGSKPWQKKKKPWRSYLHVFRPSVPSPVQQTCQIEVLLCLDSGRKLERKNQSLGSSCSKPTMWITSRNQLKSKQYHCCYLNYTFINSFIFRVTEVSWSIVTTIISSISIVISSCTSCSSTLFGEYFSLLFICLNLCALMFFDL